MVIIAAVLLLVFIPLSERLDGQHEHRKEFSRALIVGDPLANTNYILLEKIKDLTVAEYSESRASVGSVDSIPSLSSSVELLSTEPASYAHWGSELDVYGQLQHRYEEEFTNEPTYTTPASSIEASRPDHDLQIDESDRRILVQGPYLVKNKIARGNYGEIWRASRQGVSYILKRIFIEKGAECRPHTYAKDVPY